MELGAGRDERKRNSARKYVRKLAYFQVSLKALRLY